MNGALALIEREFWKFKRTPALIMMSLMLPLVQLVILGYAFGGVVKHLHVGVVDQDHGVPALELRELTNAVAANARTFETESYADMGEAVRALRDGRLNGVLSIPPGFSRKALTERDAHVALIEDNTDNFVANALAGSFNGLIASYHARSAP